MIKLSRKNRVRLAVATVLVMWGTLLFTWTIMSIRQTTDGNGKTAESPLMVMDRQLDSLTQRLFPGGVTIDSVSPAELLKQDDPDLAGAIRENGYYRRIKVRDSLNREYGFTQFLREDLKESHAYWLMEITQSLREKTQKAKEEFTAQTNN